MQLQLQQLSARHPAAKGNSVPALRGANVQLQAGEQIAVIGPSGAGKTTLLHAVACALQPASGELLIGAQNPWSLPRSALQELRGELFLAPQVPPLPPRQRVVTAVLAGRLPQMSLASSLRSLFYPSDIPAAHQALKAFDLDEKIFERVDRLSGGERQRVGLARLLASNAKLWLVDEPLSALDPTRATQALQVLTREAKARGATLVCTLHQVERALEAFPRILGLRDGEVAFDLPAAQVTQDKLRALYAQHEDELFGAAPVNEFPEQNAQPGQPAVMHCR
ncbi:ATP-binding cassette domain-containing protein [Variovorax sp. PCZ-1]|uniref:phosphonate ABC transporter ATP-binding protein n=1 Tax=Variovorax sp. PCZ-1 TaxID=2835533 RepID=UPI001BCEDD7C|nr:ATP-binding cassette domain-containing protein [Variovorax sp. PCZ-1]MBS7807462.1 ATP-binding cassette domain-containing protein [Variovorax sp. PCZ-1]